MLLLSIALTAVAAVDAQRAIRNQRRVADSALREYASFAAWSYSQHLALIAENIGREVLGAVNHGDNLHTSPRVPNAGDLIRYLPWDDACGCRRTLIGPSPFAFFALDLQKRSLSEADNVSAISVPTYIYRMAPGFRPNSTTPDSRLPPDTAGLRSWVTDSLPARIRGHPPRHRGFQFVIDQGGIHPHFMAYTLMPLAWGDTMVYAAAYTAAAFNSILGSTLDAPGLLPAGFAGGRANRDVIALTVSDRAGHALFPAAGTAPLDRSARVTTAFSIDSLLIDAVVRPEFAEKMLIGGLPATGIPFPLGLLALAAALSAIAVLQIRRESDLARLRSDFVSSVSHELRTPVAQIRLYLETLQLGRATTDAQREWALGHIARETRRLGLLVENVLRFSSLQRSQTDMQQPIDLAAAAQEVVAEFSPLMRSRGITVVLHSVPAPPAFVRSDALRHILMNLLDNAVKYGPPEQTIDVFVYPTTEGVTLCVQDEGPGIPARERELIWRPFTRGSTANAIAGSGIGLTIVRELARVHGGDAVVEAAGPRASRFLVRFPVAPLRAAPNARAAAS